MYKCLDWSELICSLDIYFNIGNNKQMYEVSYKRYIQTTNSAWNIIITNLWYLDLDC